MSSDAVWFPEKSQIEATRLYQWIKKLGYEDYDTFLKDSTDNVSWFWGEAEKALDLDWYSKYSKVLNDSKGTKWPRWFVDGEVNAVHLSIEKWAKDSDMAGQKALIWESETGEVINYTYKELAEEVARAAGGLRSLGLKKGDIVSIYMPMVPETVIAMMAISKLGGIYSPTFSGYGADAVAIRMNAAESKFLITADGFLRRGKEVPMKEEADKAVELCPSVEKVIVIKRLNRNVNWNMGQDVEWGDMLKAPPFTETVRMESSDPLMILYTSGTTGKPKGAVHTHSGFPVKAAFDAGIGMDLKKKETLFWFTDMGWMMGPFLVYGALINGASMVMYEGTPDFPEPDRLWKLVADHSVTHLGISPTLIRSFMKLGEEWVNKHSLATLRVIGSTGEPWNPEPWTWLFEKVGKKQIPIFNYSGGTEISGGILGNVLIKPIGPVTFNSALPGMAAYVYDEKGQPVDEEVGELVLTKPWVGMTQGFWKEPQRYEDTYWSRWEDVWVHGDWVMKDKEGFWTITGRSDDILNVAGKRLGPAEMESVLVDHPAVVEAGTIGIPDDIKGESAVCFVVLTKGTELTNALSNELVALAGEKLGKALRPKLIFSVSDLPKTRNAKVMRRAIKAAFLNKEAGDLSSLENPSAVEEIRKLGKHI
ncbi:AMP-binding protein [Bacillus sp. FJAT-44742]|uniref:AMP-binding protein n=1 Tax=Bacillus sp. FJAT-44742 TaxID=2014005 RepID=UPI000C2335CF|nr:AMP-binding protein [Bacillus sp. FJAT-44742]